jgi:hypothetical protein
MPKGTATTAERNIAPEKLDAANVKVVIDFAGRKHLDRPPSKLKKARS